MTTNAGLNKLHQGHRQEWAVKRQLGSWAMCDAQRDWEWVKKMAAHGDTEDLGELEDLQMVLSLADDADEEIMEDEMLKEAASP